MTKDDYVRRVANLLAFREPPAYVREIIEYQYSLMPNSPYAAYEWVSAYLRLPTNGTGAL